MIKEAYCSLEVAKLLKEKGFLQDVNLRMIQNLSYYDNIGLCHNLSKYYDSLIQDKINFVIAPTHQMACAWLREKGYHIYTFNLDPFWIYEIQSLTKDWTFSFGGFEKHDTAIEAAIKYCLENLI